MCQPSIQRISKVIGNHLGTVNISTKFHVRIYVDVFYRMSQNFNLLVVLEK